MRSRQGEDQQALSCLYLFTSSIRELYIADAVDLLAAPEGALYRFRYDSAYVDEATRSEWESPALVGCQVAVNFSLQHPADFHPAIFIPLRAGVLEATQVEGDTYVVYFRVGRYLSLVDEARWSPKERKVPVQEYTAEVKKLLGAGRNPDDSIHAILGPQPTSIFSSLQDAGKSFAAVVRFLTPGLSFSPRIYWRVAQIVNNAGRKPISIDSRGNLSLTAGQDYTLYLAHYQYDPLSSEAVLGLSVPKSMELVGPDRITLRSRYDMIPIRLFCLHREDVVTAELSIATEYPSKGPTVRIPVVVSPSIGQAASSPLLGVAAAIALAMPAIFASDRLLVPRICLAIGGAIVAGVALWLRRKHGLSG